MGGTEGPLEQLADARWDVLLQTTPLGRGGEHVELGVAAAGVVLDVSYGPRPTPLVAEARRRGLAVVDGLEMLIAQAVRQFQLLTAHETRFEIMEAAARRWWDE